MFFTVVGAAAGLISLPKQIRDLRKDSAFACGCSCFFGFVFVLSFVILLMTLVLVIIIYCVLDNNGKLYFFLDSSTIDDDYRSISSVSRDFWTSNYGTAGEGWGNITYNYNMCQASDKNTNSFTVSWIGGTVNEYCDLKSNSSYNPHTAGCCGWVNAP